MDREHTPHTPPPQPLPSLPCPNKNNKDIGLYLLLEKKMSRSRGEAEVG